MFRNALRASRLYELGILPTPVRWEDESSSLRFVDGVLQ